MQDTNWELVKFKYEVLGCSLADLAVEHDLSLPVLNFNAKDWKRIPLASKESMSLDDITSLEDVLTKLGDQTSSQTKAFAILKQKFLGPKYVELETVLLHKAIEMAQEMKSNDPRSAATLKSLTTVLTELIKNNPLLAPGDDELGISDAREWRISIVNAKEEKEKDADEES
jgi:hypothetical protein